MDDEILEHNEIAGYYGGLTIKRKDNMHFIYQEDIGSCETWLISKELYDMMKKEIFTEDSFELKDN